MSGFGQNEPSTIDLTVINTCVQRRHDTFVALHNIVVDGPPRVLLNRITSHIKAGCYKVISLSIGGPQDNHRATCVAVISSTLSLTEMRRRGFGWHDLSLADMAASKNLFTVSPL